MNYIASITSQGQITIPKPIRDSMGIKKRAIAHVTQKGDKIELKPYVPRDLLSLKGILHDNPVAKANRGKPIQQIIDEESAAFEKAIVDNVVEEMGLPPLKK